MFVVHKGGYRMVWFVISGCFEEAFSIKSNKATTFENQI